MSNKQNDNLAEDIMADMEEIAEKIKAYNDVREILPLSLSRKIRVINLLLQE